MHENDRRAAQEPDSSITEAMRAYHAGLYVPDGDLAWELMGRRLEEAKPSRLWRRHARRTAAAAGIMLALHIIFGAQNPVLAIARLFIQAHHGTGSTSVTFGNFEINDPKGMLTSPPPEEERHGGVGGAGGAYIPQSGAGTGIGAEPENVKPANRLDFRTVEEANRRTAYAIKAPAYLPEGTALANVFMFLPEGGDKSSGATLEYVNQADRNGFQLEEGIVTGTYSTATSVSDPDAVVKEVEVRGSRGAMLVSGKYVFLEWLTDTMSFRLSGMLTEEEALTIARSVK